jgi:hypothetical protein
MRFEGPAVGMMRRQLRGLAVGVASRGINWKALQMMDVLDLSVAVLRRMLNKLTHHSEVLPSFAIVPCFERRVCSLPS